MAYTSPRPPQRDKEEDGDVYFERKGFLSREELINDARRFVRATELGKKKYKPEAYVRAREDGWDSRVEIGYSRFPSLTARQGQSAQTARTHSPQRTTSPGTPRRKPKPPAKRRDRKPNTARTHRSKEDEEGGEVVDCSHCGKKIKASAARETPRDGITLHKRCLGPWEATMFPTCIHCRTAIKSEEDVVDYTLPGDNSATVKLHASCVDNYKKEKAPKCTACKKPILDEEPTMLEVPSKARKNRMVQEPHHADCAEKIEMERQSQAEAEQREKEKREAERKQKQEAEARKKAELEEKKKQDAESKKNAEAEQAQKKPAPPPPKKKDPPVCGQCNEPIEDEAEVAKVKDGTIVLHKTCVGDWEEANYAKCAHCSKLMKQKTEAPKSVSNPKTGEKVQVHPGCADDYLASVSDKCTRCAKAIVDGTQVDFEGSPYHKKCAAEEEESRKPKTVGDCAHCKKPIEEGDLTEVKDGTVKVHTNCLPQWEEEEYPKCAQCSKLIKDPTFAKLTDTETNEEVSVHSSCADDYKASKAPKCWRCTKPILEDGVKLDGESYHKACADEEEAERKPESPGDCSFCKKAITDEEYLAGDDGLLLHNDCVAEWEKTQYPSCAQCNELIKDDYVELKTEGSDEPVKLHSGCKDAYQAANAPKCTACEKPIIEGGIKLDGKPYHTECEPKEEEKSVGDCTHCKKPIMDKEYLSDDDKGILLHNDCVPEWEKAQYPECEHCKKLIKDEDYSRILDPDGSSFKVHKDCAEDFKKDRAKDCTGCGEKILEDGVLLDDLPYHKECAEKAGKTEPVGDCTFCKKPITDEEYLSGEDLLLHTECVAEWEKTQYSPCAHCKELIRDEYVEISDATTGEKASVHNECAQAYRDAAAPKCKRCTKSVLENGVKMDGEVYHKQCAEDEERDSAPKCPQCSEPIQESAIKVTLPNDKQATVHEKCVKKWKKANADVCAYCEEPITDEQVAHEGNPHHARCAKPFKAKVKILSGANLINLDGMGSGHSDPFVKVVLESDPEKVIHETDFISNDLTPEWKDETFELSIPVGDKTRYLFQMWNHNNMSENQFMGQAIVTSQELRDGDPDDKNYILRPRPDEPDEEIRNAKGLGSVRFEVSEIK